MGGKGKDKENITKKDRKFELTLAVKEVLKGVRKIAVKVVDIFGNDTTKVVEVKG